MNSVALKISENNSTCEFVSKFDWLARFFTLLGIFALPFSPTINNGFVVGAIFALLGGRLVEKWQIAFSYKMNQAAIILLVLLAVGMFYNPYGLGMGWHYFYKYAHRFLAPFVVLPLFIAPVWRKRALDWVLIGSILSVIVYLLGYWHVVSPTLILPRAPINFFEPNPYAMYIAFASFLLLQRIFGDASWRRYFYIASYAVMFYWMFFVNFERAGMLIMLGLIGLFVLQRRGLFAALVASASLLVIGTALYFASPVVQRRARGVVSDIEKYAVHPKSSMGYRITLAKYSLAHIEQAPWFGHGTGLYSQGEGGRKIDPTMLQQTVTPENTYLHMALQIGLVGLAVFLFWILMQCYEWRFLPELERHAAQAVVLLIALDGFSVPAFSPNLPGTLYLVMLAVLYAAKFNRGKAVPQSDIDL